MKKIIVSVLIVIIVLGYGLLARRYYQNNKLKFTVPKNNSVKNKQTKLVISQKTQSVFQNGSFIGQSANAYWGNVQVEAIIQANHLSGLNILQYPNSHSASVYINQQVLPILKKEAIQKQSSKVQIISGATFTSEAFIQSLASALKKAQ